MAKKDRESAVEALAAAGSMPEVVAAVADLKDEDRSAKDVQLAVHAATQRIVATSVPLAGP